MLFPHHESDPLVVLGIKPPPKRRGLRAWLREQYDDLWWTLFFVTLAMSFAAARDRKR